MHDLFEFPLAVVAHDAGAANHIIAWCNGFDEQSIHASMDGPATKLWAQAFPAWRNLTLSDALSQSGMLLTGTGWAGTLEHDARKLARASGVRSVAVIDHWTNFKDRFIRHGEEVLPDEIWVVDTYAKKLADEIFCGINIRQMPNSYLDHQVAEIRHFEQIHRKINQKINILYVLEPIRQMWGKDETPGEFQALDFFIQNMSLLGLNAGANIRLKPHPSDTDGKYDSWVGSQTQHNISVDTSSELAELIAWSDVVIGCQTYAMVVAVAAGKRVVSSIPPWAPPCVLPQPEIIKLAGLV